MKLQETVLTHNVVIDREAGEIHNVKVMGLQSKNGYRYSEQAQQQAARLYEGIEVNVDHPPKTRADVERAFIEGWGVLGGIEPKADGTYARRLSYLKTHPMTPVILERIERMGNRFGLSHNAEGTMASKNGQKIVESIDRVYSVDLVRNPATVDTLFESEDRHMPKMKTVREIVAGKAKTKWAEVLREQMEEGGIAPEMEVEEVADPAEEVKAALEKAAVAVLHKMFAGELDESAALKEIKKIFGMAEEAEGSGDESTDSAPSEEETPVPESVRTLQAKLDRMEAKTSLLESGREARDEWVDAMAMLPQVKRKKFLESLPVKSGQPQRGAKPAQSKPLRESQADDVSNRWSDRVKAAREKLAKR